MSNLLAVRRPLVLGDHQSLRENIPLTNHELSDLQPKWRKFGKAGLTLLERGEYDLVIQKSSSKLAKVKPDSLATTLNTVIVPKMPTESQALTVDVVGVDFVGKGKFPSIAFLLDAEQLQAERERITNLIDKMDGLNHRWRGFIPPVSVATIDQANADQRVLDVFQRIAPERLTLDPVLAVSD